MRSRLAVLVTGAALLAAACGSRADHANVKAVFPGYELGAKGGGSDGSDVGVSDSEVTIANLADLTGPVPGLFKAAQDGMKAFVAYINSQGGVNGRKLKLTTFDSNTNATQHRIATSRACKQAFAIVGAFSVGDNGGAQVGEKCGIPNVIDAATSVDAGEAKNTFAVNPTPANFWPDGLPTYIKQKYPSVIKKAGSLTIDNAVTKLAADRAIYTAKSVGFKFVYEELTPVIVSNFTPYVVAMKNKGVQYFTWSGEYQNLARLLQAMKQQNWRPKVIDVSPVAYSDDFLKQAGEAAEGILFYLNTAMVEEASENPEMRLYIDWLKKTVPGARPDIFGVYSWSAGLLFVKALKAAGPSPTRKKVIDDLRNTHAWTGNGLQPPTDPGGGKPSPCVMYATVKNAKFVRAYPDEGYDCKLGGLYEVKQLA
jgi:ABC-type branched-subunit amino acid transport system substrate-binding protein